jgi:hypothetical protein
MLYDYMKYQTKVNIRIDTINLNLGEAGYKFYANAENPSIIFGFTFQIICGQIE